MNHSIAFGWIDYDLSPAPEWDRAQIHRLARHPGYRLVWPSERSVLRVVDQVRSARADLVILPAPDHLSPLERSGTGYPGVRGDRSSGRAVP
ncbi:hypothetical protein GCM10011588_26930 [Nocardia jinanensis]|uniref:Uncharacterized protein n=1 Tax=Nocardia jinanensis TaxID=382504 RepID=A0A917VRN5_9NOCA|nr:hypothetical protein GCM10011588_26930 [Nocardia jinanensis]